MWDEPGPFIESCGSITSHKNVGQKVNGWFFLVITSSQHSHPLVRPRDKKRNIPGEARRRLLEWNSVMSECCQYWRCCLAVAHIYWATAPGAVTLSLYIIPDPREAGCTLASDWSVCLTKPPHWLVQARLLLSCLGLTWVDHRNIVLHTWDGNLGTAHLGNVVSEVSEWLQPGYNSDGQTFIIYPLIYFKWFAIM